MKHQSVLTFVILTSISAFAQSTKFYNDPGEKFKEARDYYQREQYSLAYPLLKELERDLRETDKINNSITVQEVVYYSTSCALFQNESNAEEKAINYIALEKNNPRLQMMSFQLGEYYFRKQDFSSASKQYEQTNIANLSNAEIARLKFHQGYTYFTQQRFNEAKPLLKTIKDLPADANYLDANYYYGFLAFRDKQYSDALESFKKVENEKEYASVVPYYIAQIYYLQDRKEESITYVKAKLKNGSNTQYYDLELKQLTGHAHFERKEYTMAQPYLEEFVNKSKKVRREDLYELSYCYYQAGQLEKSIAGFKQLSGKEDSLSQHSMYLLGDAYLKTGQKTNARNAFLFCASNSSNSNQKEVAKYQYAKLSYELGYQNEALNSLQSFLTEYPTSSYTAEAKELLVAVLANTNNYKDALTLLESLNKPSENAKKLFPRILYGRATEFINDGRLAEANSLLDRGLADPYNASVLPLVNFWKGEIAYRNNNLNDAIKFYNGYVSGGSPSSGQATQDNVRYNLGYCYLRKENYAAALSFFEPLGRGASLSSTELTQDAYLRTADCYFMQKDNSKAKALYDNVVKFSWASEDYATFQNAMIVGIKSSKDKIALLNTMNRKFPTSSLVADANMEIANTYMAEENFREAVTYLNNVLKTTDNASLKPQAMLKLGICQYNMNNNAEALKQYKNLITQYPNSSEADDAFENVKSIYVEDGKPGDYAVFMQQAGRPISVNAEDSLTFSAALSQYDKGDVNDALTAFSTYLKKFATGVHSLDATFYSAEIYNSKKDYKNALPLYSIVADKAPNQFAEKATLEAARISFFERKDYAKAEILFAQLKQLTGSQENKLEAMRGLLRSQYQLKKWTEAVENAAELTAEKGSSVDDKALANMVLARSNQTSGKHEQALANYKTVVSLNKAALAAEARYEIANTWFELGKLKDAEKAAFETINKSGSYDFWVTKSYILLGDIYFKQKDYFNAKATFQSIVDNSIDAQLKNEAQEKLKAVTEEESKSSKVGN